MAIKIPNNFNYKSVGLDPLEIIVRDKLNVNVENWVKFRHTITPSVNSNTLRSNQTISEQVNSSYLELSKSHYEVVTMLGVTKMCLNDLNLIGRYNLEFKKTFKEFYMHSGSVLDNLARLIYIVNIPNAPYERGRFGLMRHSIGYGGLKKIQLHNQLDLKGYNRIIKNRAINEIKTIRNNLTHSWPPAIFFDKIGNCYWPIAMRKKEQYYLWPHDPTERRKMNREYRKKVLIIKMINKDWIELERFQNYVFKKLIKDISKFEKNHNLKIGG